MGVFGEISTRTVCEFPDTFDDAALDALRHNDSLVFGEERCTQTFAEALGTPWLVFQVVMGTWMGAIVAPISLYRLMRMRKMALQKDMPWFSFVQSRVFFCSFAIALGITVEMVDPGGFAGLMPPPLYYILDEFIAVTCILMGVVVAEFWAGAAKGLASTQRALPVFTKPIVIVACLANFLGLQITGMVDSDQYFFWEGIKMFGGIGILVLLWVAAFVFVRRIELFLVHMRGDEGYWRRRHSPESITEGSSSESNFQTGASLEGSGRGTAASSKSGNGRGTNKGSLVSKESVLNFFKGSNRKNGETESSRIIQVLKSKSRQFSGVLTIAILAMTGNGVMSITRPQEELSWGYNILEADVFVALAFLKFVYAVAASLVLRFFRVPRSARSHARRQAKLQVAERQRELQARSQPAKHLALSEDVCDKVGAEGACQERAQGLIAGEELLGKVDVADEGAEEKRSAGPSIKPLPTPPQSPARATCASKNPSSRSRLPNRSWIALSAVPYTPNCADLNKVPPRKMGAEPL
ncbi:Hypothetical protein SCF082_LOCUS2472 [Durusdinium trenchii]|uniref:Transmembrane protein n=1 Tax=Durusdinium trenchii TaxID=1381693 RepID=A0ABP0HLC8_9DINO